MMYGKTVQKKKKVIRCFNSYFVPCIRKVSLYITWNAINKFILLIKIMNAIWTKRENSSKWIDMTLHDLSTNRVILIYCSLQTKLLTIQYIVVVPKKFCSLKIKLASKTLKNHMLQVSWFYLWAIPLSGSPLHLLFSFYI